MVRNALEAIEQKLLSSLPDDRIDGLMAIAKFHHYQYLDKVINLLLHDSVESVRERAAWALDELNDTNALSALIEAIHDPSWSVRSGAGWALVHLGSVAVPEVRRVSVESRDVNAREMAALILQRL
jgi:HEAT repeat protein